MLELNDIAFVLAAKKADSVYVIKNIEALGEFVDFLCKNPTKEAFYRFQFITRCHGHSQFGEVIIDKSQAQPSVKIFWCDPIVNLDESNIPQSSFKSIQSIHWFVPKEEGVLQRSGKGCSYFSLDGALMLRHQDQYEDIYQNPDKFGEFKNGCVYGVSLPVRMKRVSQDQSMIIEIEASHQVVNKRYETAFASMSRSHDLVKGVNAKGESRTFNYRIDRKRKKYGTRVEIFFEMGLVRMDEAAKKHKIQGLREYCQSQIVDD